jgi:hypothetical protein
MELANKVYQVCNLRYKDYSTVEGINIVDLVGRCDLGINNKLEFIATCSCEILDKDHKNFYGTRIKLSENIKIEVMIKGVTVEETYKSEVQSLIEEYLKHNYIYKTHKNQDKVCLYSMRNIKIINELECGDHNTTEIYCGKLIEENEKMCGIVTVRINTDLSENGLSKIALVSVNCLEEKDSKIYYPEALTLMSSYIRNKTKETKEKTETTEEK